MSIAELKALNVERIDLDEAVALKVQAHGMLTVYQAYQVPVPGWLTNANIALDEEIKRRQRDALKARERELSSKLAGLRTREEQRVDLEAELLKVTNALGDK